MQGTDLAAGLEQEQRVRVRIRTRQVWGFTAEIIGHEGIGASIDHLDIAGWTPTNSSTDYPVGTELDAVILSIRKARPYVHLGIPAQDDQGEA